MKRTSRSSLLWILAISLALTLVWRKMRLVVFINVTWWQLTLLILGLVVAIYLVFNVLLGRGRRM